MEKACKIIAMIRKNVKEIYGEEIARDNEFIKTMFVKLCLDMPEMKKEIYPIFNRLLSK